MTREGLAEKVGQMTGSRRFVKKLAFRSWGTILKPAAMTGRLCFAPSAGQRVRFTRPKSWIPELGPQIDTHLATKMVTSRFLAIYGPATYDDLARWWGGGGITTARQCIAAMGEEVSPVEVDGVRAWMLASEVRQVREHNESAGLAEKGSLYQYAIGRIVLWVPNNSKLDISKGLSALLDPSVHKIAIANPAHAPYGQAAAGLELWGRCYCRHAQKAIPPELMAGQL